MMFDLMITQLTNGSATVRKTISPEQRAKISATLKGRKQTPEHRAKINAALVGKAGRKPLSAITAHAPL